MIQKKNIVVTVFLLLIGIGFLAATTVKVMNTLMFIAKAKTADGVVIVTKHAKSHPRIEYTDATGKKRWFLANEWITGFRFVSYKMGLHVRVLYDPADPIAYSVDDFSSLYTIPVIGGILGIIFVLLGRCAYKCNITFDTKDMVIGMLVVLFGVGCATATIPCTKSAREFISKAKVTEGVVIGTPSGDSHPHIGYINAKGEKDWFPANGTISGYKLGEHVRVLYDPDDPKNRLINNFHDLLYPTSPEIDDFGALYSFLFTVSIFSACALVFGLFSVFSKA